MAFGLLRAAENGFGVADERVREGQIAVELKGTFKFGYALCRPAITGMNDSEEKVAEGVIRREG